MWCCPFLEFHLEVENGDTSLAIWCAWGCPSNKGIKGPFLAPPCRDAELKELAAASLWTFNLYNPPEVWRGGA